jgi:DNA transposition AAA+ family ATPase
VNETTGELTGTFRASELPVHIMFEQWRNAWGVGAQESKILPSDWVDTAKKRQFIQWLELVHQWTGRKGRPITTTTVQAADPQK